MSSIVNICVTLIQVWYLHDICVWCWANLLIYNVDLVSHRVGSSSAEKISFTPSVRFFFVGNLPLLTNIKYVLISDAYTFLFEELDLERIWLNWDWSWKLLCQGWLGWLRATQAKALLLPPRLCQKFHFKPRPTCCFPTD